MKLARTERINGLLAGLDDPIFLEQNGPMLGDLWIDHKLAVLLGKKCGVPLLELLRGTKIHTNPGPGAQPKTREYITLMQQLRNAEAERKYQAMLGPRMASAQTLNLKSVSDEINGQLTTIFNVLVSIAAVGWAFWYWCSNWQLGPRTLMSLFAAGIAGIAEVVVYSGYLRRVEESKKRSKEKPESQRVVQEFVFKGGKNAKLEPEKGQRTTLLEKSEKHEGLRRRYI